MKKFAFQTKSYRICVVGSMLVASLQSLTGQNLRAPRDDLRESSYRNRSVLFDYLRPVLRGESGAGRLYYRVQCWPRDVGNGFSFPQLDLLAPSKEKVGVDAVREIFSRSPNVTVAKDRNQNIRIRIGDINDDLLKTRITRLLLKPRQRYNPLQAILAIEGAPEIEAKMRELGAEEPLAVIQEHLQDPAPELPHLPASLKNITMDEALDRVAHTFGGLIMYGECMSTDGKRLFSVDFVPVADYESKK